ncbi:MAG: Ig-like domain-containing protein [Prevotellaceae bacterium]|jgi:hypothetical protein|nr:Ig-like domain-containing protein [Prevotellaceae bacterium]
MNVKRFLIPVAAALCALFTGCKDNDSDKSLQGITMEASVRLKPDETKQLSVTFFPSEAADKTLKWTSSKPEIATVSTDGLVTALNEGSAVITATSTADASIKATCDVTVSAETITDLAGEIQGTWEKGSNIYVSGQIRVPEGKTLTIEEGVTVIFSNSGVGESHTAIELIVDGKLYCKGTAAKPVTFTVSESQRSNGNQWQKHWGGIVCGAKCPEAVFDHVIIEYTGNQCIAESPSVIDGYYTAGGDFTPAITTNNVNGNYVVQNSTIRFTGESDALYFMGGNAIIANNTFYSVGETGAEAINMKAGVKIDAAFNLIFSPNTNGFKLSSSGQNAERQQALVRAYNNTVVNAGWRRTSIKGGSIFVEKNALVSVFNNLMVNCKFMAKTPKWDTPDASNGADNNSVIDYNFYASGSQTSPFAQDSPDYLTAFLGYTAAEKDYWHAGKNNTPKIDEHSIVSASAGDSATDPKFLNFAINSVPLEESVLAPSWDFHVQAASPVLSNAYSNFTGAYTPYFGASGLTIGGTNYKTPAPAARFGAFGTN